ncbi:hypothetical protein ACWCQV_31005, partial [Streptomyces eurythermus]
MPNSSPPRTPPTPPGRARPGAPASLHGTLPAAYDRALPAARAAYDQVGVEQPQQPYPGQQPQ